MNRVVLAVAKLRYSVGAQETIEMKDLQGDLVAMMHDQKIFSRLKIKLVERDQLNPEEVESIQTILTFWENVSAFECWFVDRYLIRAHLLELERWPDCPFDELPLPWPERLAKIGPNVWPMLREAAA